MTSITNPKNMTNPIIPIPIKTAGGSDFVPAVTAYLPNNDDRNKPAVVIFAGGAYKVVSQYEAAPTARKYADRGFAAFCVQYSCLPAVFPQSLCEGLWVIRYLREQAETFGIDAGNITAMGFSAGGHLAAALGTLWDTPVVKEYLGEDTRDCRPDRLVLCYPVLSNEGAYHKGSFLNLLGSDGFCKEELRRLTCLEHQVTEETPPTFLWHGGADRDVPVSGSVRFLDALIAHNVPVEFHLYPFAAHGGGLNSGAYHRDWSDKAEVFMRDERLRDCGGKPT
ncbi:MAG TPA: acetylesterase [Clostridiales bacterium]|nr:acetylesterase [Clostridiales bacterium]